MDVQGVISYATDVSKDLRLLLSNERRHVIKTNRDGLCLLYWSLTFEHHDGLLLLLREGCHAPAFALLRPFVEAFSRLYVAMHGTENQVAALWAGKLNNIDLVDIWGQVDQRLGSTPLFGPKYQRLKGALHGFTHGGKEQLVRQASGTDIVSNYTEVDVRGLLYETMPVVFLAAVFTTEFLGYPAENQTAAAMFGVYMDRVTSGQI
jgi:hypothetical protein